MMHGRVWINHSTNCTRICAAMRLHSLECIFVFINQINMYVPFTIINRRTIQSENLKNNSFYTVSYIKEKKWSWKFPWNIACFIIIKIFLTDILFIENMKEERIGKSNLGDNAIKAHLILSPTVNKRRRINQKKTKGRRYTVAFFLLLLRILFESWLQ